MSTAILIEVAAKSVLVCGVTLLLLEVLKKRSAAQRSWLAHAGLAVLLLLPVGSLVLPSLRLNLLPPLAGPTVESGRASVERAGPFRVTTNIFDWSALVTAAYLAVAAVLLFLTVVSILRLFGLRARSAVLVDANWLTALALAQRRMGVKYGAALLVNDEIKSPISWGMARPTILLNETVVPLHNDAEAIIAHELAHVARLDWAKLLASRIATALFWFNPLVWLLARQCHQLREEAADDAVLRSDIPDTDYAALLIGAARHEGKGALLAAHGVAPGRGSLKQRIARVLDEDRPRLPAAAPWAAACLVGAVLVGGPLSALTLQPGQASAGLVASRTATPARQPLTAVSTIAAAAPKDAISPTPQKVAPTPPAPPAARPREDGRSPPFDPLAPDFGERIASLVTGTADTSKLVVPSENEFAAAGYAGLHERQKTVLTAMGVTPSYMRDLGSAGYTGLSVSDLVDLKRSGITADLIRKSQKPGEARLTPDELVALRDP